VIDLCEQGEGLAEAAARCAAMGVSSELEMLAALNDGSRRAPKLTDDGVAADLRFRVACASYIAKMTPDPRPAANVERPIPAEPILDALRAAGYRIRGERRTQDGLTHETLAEHARMGRRQISRICQGKRPNLTSTEARALLDAIDRDDLIPELVDAVLDKLAADAVRVEEELAEIYELMWICGRHVDVPREERLALHDLHLLDVIGQSSAGMIRLPFAKRRELAIERFCGCYGRQPHPVPQAVRVRARAGLGRRHQIAVDVAAVLRREIGPPERVNDKYAGDLIRRARRRGLIDPTERPRAFAPDRAATAAVPSSRGGETFTLPFADEPEVAARQSKLRHAERGMEREVAELRALRAAPELPHRDPRRLTFAERFSTLAAKQARRAAYRNRWRAEIRVQIAAAAHRQSRGCAMASD
jgi:hypothetical protein